MATLANNNNNNNNLQLLNEEPERVAGFTLREQQMFLILQMLRNNDIDAPQQGPLTSLPSVFSISRPMHYNGGYKPGRGFYAHFRTIKAIVPWAALYVCESFDQVPRLRRPNGGNINRSPFNIQFYEHRNNVQMSPEFEQLNLRPPAANWVLPFGRYNLPGSVKTKIYETVEGFFDYQQFQLDFVAGNNNNNNNPTGCYNRTVDAVDGQVTHHWCPRFVIVISKPDGRHLALVFKIDWYCRPRARRGLAPLFPDDTINVTMRRFLLPPHFVMQEQEDLSSDIINQMQRLGID